MLPVQAEKSFPAKGGGAFLTTFSATERRGAYENSALKEQQKGNGLERPGQKEQKSSKEIFYNPFVNSIANSDIEQKCIPSLSFGPWAQVTGQTLCLQKEASPV